MKQPKTGGKLIPYSATSPNARRNITESTKGHIVIFGIDWSIVLSFFSLNCIYMQAVLQEIQAVAKPTPLQ